MESVPSSGTTRLRAMANLGSKQSSSEAIGTALVDLTEDTMPPMVSETNK
jgi:hypothetical protein